MKFKFLPNLCGSSVDTMGPMIPVIRIEKRNRKKKKKKRTRFCKSPHRLVGATSWTRFAHIKNRRGRRQLGDLVYRQVGRTMVGAAFGSAAGSSFALKLALMPLTTDPPGVLTGGGRERKQICRSSGGSFVPLSPAGELTDGGRETEQIGRSSGSSFVPLSPARGINGRGEGNRTDR